MQTIAVFFVVCFVYLAFHYLVSKFIFKRPATAFEIRKSFVYICLIIAVMYAAGSIIFQHG